MVTDSGEWLTVNEAANLSNYDPEHIRRLIREGRIEGRKVSIVWLVERKSLLSYITEAQARGKKRGRKSEK